jgi:HlyD family secretion protein
MRRRRLAPPFFIGYSPNVMKKSLFLIPAALLAAAGAIGAAWYFFSDPTAEVRVVEVRLTQLQSKLSTNGKAEAESVHEIRAPFSGACRGVRVAAGEEMKPGQPILTIEDPARESEFAAARAELEAARSDLETTRRGPAREELGQAEAEVVRLQAELESAQKIVTTNEWLLARSAIARNELDQSRRDVDRLRRQGEAAAARVADMRARSTQQDIRRASARLEAAQARVRLLESNAEKAVVRAPFAGNLFQFELKPGSHVNVGELIGLFADLSRLRVIAFVDEPELGQVTSGADVEIRWDAHPLESWRAKVRRIPAQVVTRGSRTVAEIICALEEPRRGLIPNINLDVEILTPAGPEVAALPRGAALLDGREYFVWRIRDSRAVRQTIEAGRGTSQWIEVRGGLSVGDKVILPGELPLAEGMSVRVASK